MTTIQLLTNTAGAAGLLYAGTIAISAITALATADREQRRAALQVLALLTRGTSTGPDQT